jgi:uncharacterized membrane protein
MDRDIAKTLSFAALHFTVGFLVSYVFTGSVAIAGSIALVEPLANTFVFYFHERAWRRSSAGREGVPSRLAAHHG